MKKIHIFILLAIAVLLVVVTGSLYPMIQGKQLENRSMQELVKQGDRLKQNNHWRGIVFGPEGRETPDDLVSDFENLVEGTLAPIGINFIVFDMHWNNYRFTSIPELDKPSRPANKEFTKEHAAKVSAICKRHGIKVIVGLNFLTHQNHGQLLKGFPQFQWPGKENLWDPLNPKVNEIAFKMADEVIDSFDADAIHIGLDEGWGFDVKNHPKAGGLSSSALLAKAINEYHQHFVVERKIEMLMWSDMLEGRYSDAPVEETLDLIPKDIIMASWEYDRKLSYPWPQNLIDKGFRVLVCPWKDPVASQKFVNAGAKIKDERMLGVLYTTWSSKVATHLGDAIRGEVEETPDEAIVGVANSIKRTIGLF